jgi:SNF2 family DNA or RNA helicase
MFVHGCEFAYELLLTIADHKYLEKRWVDSAKVAKCIEIIDSIQQECPQEKTIVFSQFTSLLDFLEIPISRKAIQYRRYDGGMSSAKRNQALNDFTDDVNVKVLLVSLKAGNSGLNLACASQVIIFGTQPTNSSVHTPLLIVVRPVLQPVYRAPSYR